MEKAYTPGATDENLMAIGKTTAWTATEFSHGLMDASTKVNTSRTKNTAMENSTGLMGKYTKEIGKMGSNMVLGRT